MTKIEWTEKTWNPIVGCSVVSPGCTNCYAMKMAARIERMGGAPQYDGTTKQTRAGAVFTGKVALAEKALTQPLKRKKPTTYFVNSMGDLFHENVKPDWLIKAIAVMALCPQHTFQILTKRSEIMRSAMAAIDQSFKGESGIEWLKIQRAAVEITGDPCAAGVVEDRPWPLPNVWLGVSAEDQTRADERIPDLLATPAAVRFVSAEPLLGPINLELAQCNCPWPADAIRTRHLMSCPADRRPHRKWSLDWVIVGGESGPGARPMHPNWARSIRDQCVAAQVPFFFKQWGESKPGSDLKYDDTTFCMDHAGRVVQAPALEQDFPPGASSRDKWVWMRRVGKKAAGRLLDGIEHNGYPK